MVQTETEGGVKWYGSKKVPMKPEWMKKMHRDRDKVLNTRAKQHEKDGTNVLYDDVPVPVLYPSKFLQETTEIPAAVQNYSVIDLDLDMPQLRQNIKDAIDHHRYWTWTNSEVTYKWDNSDDHQSWVSPPSGTYLYYIRYQNRMMCLVGDGAQSWFGGVLTENVCAEFTYDPLPEAQLRDQVPGQGQPAQFIVPTPNVKKFQLPGKGNYKNAEDALLGPWSMRNAFDVTWNVLHGLGGGDLDSAIDVFVIHLWDSARNDLIRERTMSAFKEHGRAIYLDKVHVIMMKNWQKMSKSILHSIEALHEFKNPWRNTPAYASWEDSNKPISTLWEASSVIRILNRPTAEPKGSFHMKNLPIPLENGGRALKTAISLPGWVTKWYPERKIPKAISQSERRGNEGEAEAKISSSTKSSVEPRSMTNNSVGKKTQEDKDTKTSEEYKARASSLTNNSEEARSVSCCLVSMKTQDCEASDNLSDKTMAKYKDAGKIINDVMALLSYCIPNAVVAEICLKIDASITERIEKIYKNIKKKGLFTTCLTVNNVNRSFCLKTILNENDMINIDIGCHIDGYAAVSVHSFVVNGKVTGKAAQVIAAANRATEAALRLIRPEQVCCKRSTKSKIVGHRLKQFAIVSGTKTKVDDLRFEENEIYAVDIFTSTKPGDLVAHNRFTVLVKPKGLDRITTSLVQELHSSMSSCDNAEINACIGRRLKKKAKKKAKKCRSEKKKTEEQNWHIENIKGDGRCLYRALVLGEYFRINHQKMNEDVQTKEADTLRNKIIQAMVDNCKDIIEFIIGDFDAYVNKMRSPFSWGGHPELVMARSVLGVPIHVYRHKDGLICHSLSIKEDENELPGINVLYDGQTHYDLLLPRENQHDNSSIAADYSSSSNQDNLPGPSSNQNGSHIPLSSHKADEEESDTSDEIVPVVVQPGHIHFEPAGGQPDKSPTKETQGTFQWSGTMSKKKGQKCGLNGSNKKNANIGAGSSTEAKHCFIDSLANENGFCAVSNQKDDESHNILTSSVKTVANEEKINGEPSDFEILYPLTQLPKEGDLIAYRLVELSSYHVGKVLIYDPISLQIILLPVPEYPIATKENRPEEESDNLSPYKEDGSLEIEYSSLLNVRLLKGIESVTRAVSTPSAETWKEGGPLTRRMVTLDNNEGNVTCQKTGMVANNTKDQESTLGKTENADREENCESPR